MRRLGEEAARGRRVGLVVEQEAGGTDGVLVAGAQAADVDPHAAYAGSRCTVSGPKAGQADRDVLRAAVLGRGVAHPLPAAHEHGLAGAHVQLALLVLHAQAAAEHDRVLVELRALPGLEPALRRAHAGDAHALLAGVHAADELLDALRLRARRLDGGRAVDELGHRAESTGAAGPARRRR